MDLYVLYLCTFLYPFCIGFYLLLDHEFVVYKTTKGQFSSKMPKRTVLGYLWRKMETISFHH